MRALWLEDRSLSLRGGPQPVCPGEALVRVRLAGICGTDLELVKGYYPYTGIPGHEFVGEIVARPPGDGPLQVGMRVVGEINATCGSCEACRRDRSTHCESRTVLGIIKRHGVFADFVSVPLACLHAVPDHVPDEAAVFCEPLAAALEIQEQVHLAPGQRVLLVGAGRLGLLIARTLSLTGVDLQVVARQPAQRHLLAAWGIRCVTAGTVEKGRSDVVVEASGSPEGFALARHAVRPRGTMVMKSTYHGTLSLDMSSIVVDEVTLVGSRCGPFGPALRLMANGSVDPTPLVAARYPLERAIEAFARASEPGTLKVLVEGGR